MFVFLSYFYMLTVAGVAVRVALCLITEAAITVSSLVAAPGQPECCTDRHKASFMGSQSPAASTQPSPPLTESGR